MVYTEQELVQMVVAKIDQIMPPGELIEGGTVIDSPVPYIRMELQASANHVLRQAPDVQVKQVLKKADKHFPVGSTDPITPTTNPSTRLIFEGGVSKIPLPTDFLRFIDIQLAGWLVPVSSVMKQSDPKYIREKSIPMLRGTEIKPKAALVSFSDYLETEKSGDFKNVGLAVECFSNLTAPATFVLHYIPKTVPTQIPEDLIDAMLWECAGRTFVLLNMNDRAKAAFNQVERYFSNKYGLYGEAR